MDIEQLKKIIEDSLKDGVFSLDVTILGSPGITVLAAHYLPAKTLKLSGASIKNVDSNSITVGGTGDGIPFKGMNANAKFYILQECAALTMKATGGTEWTLATAIPAFDNTLAASVKYAAIPDPPAFFFLSDPDEGKQNGLTFAGTMDVRSMSSGISDLLGIQNETITGPVKLEKGGSEFVSIDLDGAAIENVDLWVAKNCTVQFKMESYVLPNPVKNDGVAIPNLTLVTTIPFNVSGTEYKLPLSVQIINPDRAIRLSADITESINASLDVIGKFIGGANLKGAIPPHFDVADYVRFKSLFLDFDVNGKSVDTIGLEVGNEEPWTIVTVESTGKTFRADNVFLRFEVMTPFSDPQPYLNIGGELSLTDKASLFISASYPNFEILGSLTDGSELSVREFIMQFVGDPVNVPEILFVETLNFDLKAGDYSFEISLVGFWEINSGQNRLLIIDSLSFAVQYTAAIQTASFAGTITVGSVDITITADYNGTDDKKGWIFTGKTGKDQRIYIREFSNYLAETFGAGEPPEWIQGISLQDLSVTINTLDRSFEFSVTGNIPVAANKELKIMAGFSMNALEEGGYKKVLSGKLYIGRSEFTLVFESTPSNSNITATWAAINPDGYLQFADIAHAFGFDEVPPIPDGLDLSLKEARIYYDFTTDKQSLVLAAASASYGTAVFVARKIAGEWTYVFGIDIKIDIDLANLPLVGTNLESVVGKAGLDDFKLIGATRQIKEPDVITFNKLITDKAGPDYPTLPQMPEGIEKGLYCALVLKLGMDNKYEVPLSTATKKAPAIALMPVAGTPAKDNNAYWVQLQKTIGPVYFDRAGLAYKDGRVSLLLDASLIFTALKIDLISLGVSNPLKKFDPDFELSGLSIAYQSGPVQISAGFLKQVVNNITEYSGMAVIGLSAFNLSALGSYASVDGHPSLFIFALLSSPPLGGPPAFFVTGVAAGFGYNRGLKLPTIDTVPQFPLTMGFVPNQKSPFKGPDPNEALKVLIRDNVVPVQIGQNWLAAGVKFTSFQLVESFALLSFAFGTNLEIGIIGMSTVAVPSKSPVVVAYAQLALLVKLLPDIGVFSVEAKLTPASYLLSTSCVLTGGFAFYLWTAPNEHEGDFVITLGGYHPSFTPPVWYPRVPRLGFNWVVTREVFIKGGMYFALTPTCIMAGGSLEATFNSGNLKAWFIIGADFLIAWKPYRYEARLYLSFGVSYTFRLDLLFTSVTKTISVSLGADMFIWGPEFSGIATIHLYIISFNISFGASGKKATTTISWQDFKESFLPPSDKTRQYEALYGTAAGGAPVPTDTYCLGKVTSGIVEDLAKDRKNDEDISWIVNPDDTTLETYTIIPAKEFEISIEDANGIIPAENLVFVNPGALADRNKDFGVGMVGVANGDFNSKHTVKIKFEGVLSPKIKYEVTAIIRNVPKSLWEKRAIGYTKEAVVKNVLVGFKVTPRAPVPDQSVPIDLEHFKYRFQDYAHAVVPAEPQFVPGPPNVNGMTVLKETINSEPATTVRKNIIDALRKRGVPVNPNVNVEEIAAQAEDFIMAPPVLSYTYWKEPV